MNIQGIIVYPLEEKNSLWFYDYICCRLHKIMGYVDKKIINVVK